MKIFNILALSFTLSTFIACSDSDSNSNAGPARPSKEAILGSEAYKNLQGTWESQNPKSKLEFTSDVTMKVSFIDVCAAGETLSIVSSVSSVSESRVEIPNAEVTSKLDQQCGFEISSFNYSINGKNLVIETDDGDISYVRTSAPVVVDVKPPVVVPGPANSSITKNGGPCTAKEKADTDVVFNQALNLSQKLESNQSVSKVEVATLKASFSAYAAKYIGLNCTYEEAGETVEVVLDEEGVNNMNSLIAFAEQFAQ